MWLLPLQTIHAQEKDKGLTEMRPTSQELDRVPIMHSEQKYGGEIPASPESFDRERRLSQNLNGKKFAQPNRAT